MKNLLIVLIVFALSCNSPNEQIQTPELVQESVNPKESEQPLDIDSNFFEFMLKFSAERDFQLKRSKIQGWQYFKIYDKDLENVSNLFNASQEDFEKDKMLERRVVFIDLKTMKRNEFLFNKKNQVWFLVGYDEITFDIKSDHSFENFLYNFSKDTNYRKSHIKYPLKFSYLKDDFEPTVKYVNLGDEYEFDIFDNEKLLYFKDARETEPNKINLWIRGIDNGINVNLNFQQIKGKWFLIDEDDSST